MGEAVSKYFIPLNYLPGLYSIPEDCKGQEADFDPSFAGIIQLLFLGGVYGWILFKGSNMIAEGSEILLIFPKIAPIVGSLILPILGAVPDGAIVLFSGLGNVPKKVLQKQLNVGVGTLAGSTIMLLTVPWFLVILAGRTDDDTGGQSIQPHRAQMHKGSKMMLLSLLSYVIIQIGLYISPSNKQSIIIIASIYCIGCFVLYLWVELSAALRNDTNAEEESFELQKDNLIQQKLIDRGVINFKNILLNSLKASSENSGAMVNNESTSLLSQEEVFTRELKVIFDKFDVNHSNTIDIHEFVCLSLELGLEEEIQPYSKRVALLYSLFEQIDSDKNASIEFEELKNFVLEELDTTSNGNFKVVLESISLMTIGSLLILFFSDPMIDVIVHIAETIGVSSFYVSFIVVPIISNSSEFISAYIYALKKSTFGITLSLSTLQGAIVMNNTFCLFIFLALIYFNDLEWSYGTQVWTIVIVELIMVYVGFYFEKQTLFHASFILLLLPLSLLI